MWRLVQSVGRNVLTKRHTTVRRTCAAYSSEANKSPGSADSQPQSTFTNSADVVIIGGGVIGCSTLYHLAKMGVTNVVLLEKDQITAGTTWHTAGLVWSLRPSDIEVELLQRSKALMGRLEGETGVDPGWINNGGLFIASTTERLDEYKRLMTLGKAFATESYVLSPAGTKQLYPLMNVADIKGSLYSPSDGTIDPAGYCTALLRAATNKGARAVTDCSVTGIRVTTDDFGTPRVTEVHTDRGDIQTSCVVNCAGVWAPALGAMAEVKVPLVALKHAYVVTETIPGVRNLPNVRDHDASVYLKLQGDALCVGGYEQNPVFWHEVRDDFAFSLFELDWDVFSANIEGAVNRVPAVGETGIKSTVCGPESFTADHKPLMGESPEVRGFYLGCGFNSSGMMLSGGCGEQLARWIVEGRPQLDMFSYDIRRFPTQLTDNKVWLASRSHEAYAKNYSIVFPHDEPLAGRNLMKDVLHEVLARQGCVYQERQGWERPGWFSPVGYTLPEEYDYYGQYGHALNETHKYQKQLQLDYTFQYPPHHNIIGSECMACREKAALFNMSYFGKFYLVGRDAQKAADWIFSNNMHKSPGSTVYTCMLNKDGGVEADLTVSILNPGTGSAHSPDFQGVGFYVAVGGGQAQHGYSHMLDVIQDERFDCHLIDHTEDMALLSVQGPNSRQILQSLTDTDLSDEAFPFSTHQVLQLAGHEVRALRLSFVGELGWEIHVPNAAAVAVYEAVMAAGQPLGIVNAGYRAIDSLSIEKGYRHWHADVRSDDTPLESGLAFTCKLKSDTPFLGREALERQKADGVRKRLACFTVAGRRPLHGLEAIWRHDMVVGFVRRADYGHALGTNVAYGYVRRADGGRVDADYLRSGVYSVELMGDRVAARLHTRSPFDPLGLRVRGVYGGNGGGEAAESVRRLTA